MAHSLADNFCDRDSVFVTGAFPMTTPGQFDDEPWNKSTLAWLEDWLELNTWLTEHLKERVKLLQESDANPERIARVQNKLQYVLAYVETIKADIELEKKNIVEDQKYATKVSKQQVKRPRQIAKPEKQENIPIGKQTTEVPKKQKKVLEA